jgi:glycosyltransferase involved in cell wall biosynthesis
VNETSYDLAVVMPVYNEESVISSVLDKWTTILDSLGTSYHVHVYNDGSKDKTLSILTEYAEKNKNITVHDKLNSGHGPTILNGYRANSHVPWILQIDSDDEMQPAVFPSLWNKRNHFDFLIGRRTYKKRATSRVLVSFLSQLSVWLFYGSGVSDVNAPYRLMRTDIFRMWYQKIPSETFAPNVIISAIANKKRMRIFEVPIEFNLRTTGKVSLAKEKLLGAALRSFVQVIAFRLKI